LSREARQIELSEYRSKRFEARRQRLARDTAMRRGSRRRSVARPENPDIQDSGLKTFSRTRAREEIAAAVARVQQRRRNAGKATARPRDPDQDGRS
ncbi:MAG: hypothetical protein KDI29_04095, partial [Pseudomonadales bacterium]|nr:hypothetical protein [Pseudomonadales bacterium]